MNITVIKSSCQYIKKKKRTTTSSAGIGLKNINKRYRLLGDYEVELVDQAEVFKVIIPIIRRK